jgi:dolichol kinase
MALLSLSIAVAWVLCIVHICGNDGCSWLIAPFAFEMDVFLLIGVQTCLLIFLQLGDKVLPSTFAARKICHAGSGFLMLYLDSKHFIARWYVYAVVVFSISMTWRLLPKFIPQFRFGDEYDFGITAYLLIVGAWFYLQLPVRVLSPLFFADPAGAVVGKFCSKRFPKCNPKWYENKTVAGTLAVFIFAFHSLVVPTYGSQALVAALCSAAEALGGKTFDNVVIAAVVISSWVCIGPDGDCSTFLAIIAALCLLIQVFGRGIMERLEASKGYLQEESSSK